jgi:CRISPR/Cas system-associated protein Csm6
MATVTPNINQARAMRVAIKRIEGFAKQFGEAHRNLARHAAFPFVLTPDLLYQIWANFVPQAPWIAVAHVLLSRLCRQVGYEMYEMDIADRNLLLRELKEQFGQERLNELGEFLLDYVAQRLTGDDPDTQDLAEAQEWTVLAYTKPDEAVRELAERLSERVKQEDMGEVLRLASLVETLAEPLVEAGFEPLLVDVSRIASEARDNFEAATDQLGGVLQQGNLLESASVILPISKQIEINQFEHLLYDLSFASEAPDWIFVNSTKTKSMRRVVISTLGTSLLTKQLDRDLESDWFEILQRSTNYTTIELQQERPDVEDIIHTLKKRALQTLTEGDIRDVRLASTELSVIYALYQGNLEQGKQDYHFLIASDTAISTEISNIIHQFLIDQGLNVQIYQPKGFSTASSETFNHGIDELMVWLDDVASNFRKSGYSISFNLVASSRVLQAYMDIIGMLYADELIYVLEGANPKLISIPKIPIQIDTSIINPVKFALMEAGSINLLHAQDIPQQFIFVVDNEAILSNWGALIWRKCKDNFLANDLLYFPGLAYEESFRHDYNKIKNLKDRVKLQETLAKVSSLLTKANGDTTILRQDGGLHYVKFQNIDLYHFRVSESSRVSCMFSDGTLRLRRYGLHDYVNGNP